MFKLVGGYWILLTHEYDRNVFIVIGGVNYALCESGKVIKWRWVITLSAIIGAREWLRTGQLLDRLIGAVPTIW